LLLVVVVLLLGLSVELVILFLSSFGLLLAESSTRSLLGSTAFVVFLIGYNFFEIISLKQNNIAK
jgi:hypothetical protein